MAEPATHQPDAAPVRRRNGWFSWLILFLVGTAAVSLAAVYLPPQVKKLGLLAIGQGLAAGWIAARLASMFELSAASKAFGCGVVFLVILGGQLATAVESHRVYRLAEERALAAHPKRLAALRMLESVKLPEDARSKQTVADVRKTIGVRGTSFADYLQFRVSEVGIQSRRAAQAIWIVEILLGSLAGTWIFRRLAPSAQLEPSGPAAKLEE